jgi:gliding motility-associated-like protein
MTRTCTFLFFLFSTALLAESPPQFVRFVPNRGQWDEALRFRADVPGGTVSLRSDGLLYTFYDAQALADRHAGKRTAPNLRMHGIRVVFEGANPAVQPVGDLSDGLSRNYFLGNDPARWASDVPGYGEVTYRNLYPGIDLRLFTHQASLKYEFLVRPGADPGLIRWRVEGAEGLSLDAGQLVIRTSLGEIREAKPYNYQEIGGEAKPVVGGYLLRENRVSFNFSESYDARYPLVIDPQLIFSTFSGSVADNWGHTATYDAEGNLLSGGSAFGVADFPATTGAYQLQGGGDWDVAILKFNPTGTRLLYATYLGGLNAEVPHSLIVNRAGELVVFGTTSSTNFPTTATAYDRTFNGGSFIEALSGMIYSNGSDLFVAKLSADGRTLRGATYFGGSGNDGLNLNSPLQIRNYGDAYRGEVVVGTDDDVYVGSVTRSRDSPAVGTLSGIADVLTLRFNADLSVLKNAVLSGGLGYDAAYGLRVTPAGTVYLCGATTSQSWTGISTAGTIKPALGGSEDGFVLRLTFGIGIGTVSNARLSYLGTPDADAAQLVDVDSLQNVYVLGLSSGGRYPVSGGVYANRNSGQFIQALDRDLTRSLFSTTIGSGRGTPDIVPTAFLVSECGNLYVSGWGGKINQSSGSSVTTASSTTGLPVTPDGYRTTTDGSNFYLMMLETGAKSLLYATFLGSTNTEAGDHVDGGTCRFDKRGFIYHAACSCNRTGSPANFTTTPGAWSRTNNAANCNNAAFKFDIDNLDVAFDVFRGTEKDVVEGCAPLTLRFVNRSAGGKTYEWDLGGLSKSSTPDEVTYTFDKAGEYEIKLVGRNPLSCRKEAIATRKIRVIAADFNVSPDVKICRNETVQLTAEGAIRYRWSPAATLSGDTIPNPKASPTASTAYTVELTNAAGCKATRNVRVDIDESFTPQLNFDKVYDCQNPTELRMRVTNTGASITYAWALGNGDTLRGPAPDGYVYPKPGTYPISVVAQRGNCRLAAAQPVVIEPPLRAPNVVTPNGDGKNDTFVLNRPDVKLDVYHRWGSLLFHADRYADDWGKDVVHGTYYYLLTFPDGRQCKGWVEVME